MALKDRLGRLGAPTRSGAVAPERRPGGDVAVGLGTLREQEDPLAELRQSIASLLEETRAREPVEKPPRPLVDTCEALPFVTVDTPWGPLAQRLTRKPASTAVGRIQLARAAEVDVDMLSLLALDPELSSVDPRRALYFDTETTGLGGAGAVAFLVGLGWYDDDGAFVLEQLLLDEPGQEPALLGRLGELIEQSSLLVSFNGKSFDWPLLAGRCVMNRRQPFPARPHLDLLHVSRRVHKRRLSRCRLIDLESEVLGWERGEDDIPGAEIPPRYGHYLRTGDGEALRPVVDHNAWDVLSMAALVGLYGEPVDELLGMDLLGVAETLTRAGAYDRAAFEKAERAADRALALGEGVDGLSVRARLFKARGDKARALLDFEALSRQVDDPTVRLELAKLFEHHEKDYARALQIIDLGTGEDDEALQRRRTRLVRRESKRSGKPR